MMKETNIQPQVTSAIAGDNGEAAGKVKKTLRKWLPKKPNEGLKNLMVQDGMWLYPLTHVYR